MHRKVKLGSLPATAGFRLSSIPCRRVHAPTLPAPHCHTLTLAHTNRALPTHDFLRYKKSYRWYGWQKSAIKGVVFVFKGSSHVNDFDDFMPTKQTSRRIDRRVHRFQPWRVGVRPQSTPSQLLLDYSTLMERRSSRCDLPPLWIAVCSLKNKAAVKATFPNLHLLAAEWMPAVQQSTWTDA